MIRLAIKLLILVISIFVISNIVSCLIVKYRPLLNIFETSQEVNKVYSVINKSNAAISSETIILGDSVANQIFPASDSNFIIFAPSTIVGQYIILSNALKSNKNIKKVVLVCIPGSLEFKFNTVYTYNHFIRPFYGTENSKLISNSVDSYLNQQKYHLFYQLPMAKVLPVFSQIDCSKETSLSASADDYDLFIEYMNKIKTLCASSKVIFKVLPPPISETRNRQFDLKKFKDMIVANKFDGIFSSYFDIITVKNDSYFKDTWHYKEEFVNEMAGEFKTKAKEHLSTSMN